MFSPSPSAFGIRPCPTFYFSRKVNGGQFTSIQVIRGQPPPFPPGLATPRGTFLPLLCAWEGGGATGENESVPAGLPPPFGSGPLPVLKCQRPPGAFGPRCIPHRRPLPTPSPDACNVSGFSNTAVSRRHQNAPSFGGTSSTQLALPASPHLPRAAHGQTSNPRIPKPAQCSNNPNLET